MILKTKVTANLPPGVRSIKLDNFRVVNNAKTDKNKEQNQAKAI